MSMSKAIILVCALLAISCSALASAVTELSPPTNCAVTKYALPGDTFTLTGPTAPTGVTYYWGWQVKDATGAVVKTDNVKATTFTIPTSSPTSWYSAILTVTSGTSQSQLAGCSQQSCLLINVQQTTSCLISGANTVCQTDNSEPYTYTGNAVLTGASQSAYLKWYVDGILKVASDTSGVYNVNWVPVWTGGTGSQTSSVKVEVYSLKMNTKMTDCTYTVTLLPTPATTIAPT
jgi:hypothetical protein